MAKHLTVQPPPSKRKAMSTFFNELRESLEIRFRGYESTEEEELMMLCFPRLSSLTISNCPNLNLMSLFPPLDDVLHLYDTSLVPLQRTMKMRGWRSPSSPVSSSSILPLSKLKELYIGSIEDLESLPEIGLQNLSSFRLLSIWECQRLKSLPLPHQGMPSLQKLEIRNYGDLKFPSQGVSHLPFLQKLEINGCSG